MSRVIKHGVPYGIRLTCPLCGCVFETGHDTKIQKKSILERTSPFHKDFVPGYEFECPDCRKSFSIPERVLTN